MEKEKKITIEEFLEGLRELIFQGIFYKGSPNTQVWSNATIINDKEKSLNVYLNDESRFIISVSE